MHASKPYVYGSIHWALRDFRVDPTWQGGAPRRVGHAAVAQQEPDQGDNARKPVFFEVQKRWRKTRPLR